MWGLFQEVTTRQGVRPVQDDVRTPRKAETEPSDELLAEMENRRHHHWPHHHDRPQHATRSTRSTLGVFNQYSSNDSWVAELLMLGMGDYLPLKKENNEPLAFSSSYTKNMVIEAANKRALELDDAVQQLMGSTGCAAGSSSSSSSRAEDSLREQTATLAIRDRVAGKHITSIEALNEFLLYNIASTSAVTHSTLCELTPPLVKAELEAATSRLNDAEVFDAIERVLSEAKRARLTKVAMNAMVQYEEPTYPRSPPRTPTKRPPSDDHERPSSLTPFVKEFVAKAQHRRQLTPRTDKIVDAVIRTNRERVASVRDDRRRNGLFRLDEPEDTVENARVPAQRSSPPPQKKRRRHC